MPQKQACSYAILSTIRLLSDVKYSRVTQKPQKHGLSDYTLHYTLHSNVDILLAKEQYFDTMNHFLFR